MVDLYEQLVEFYLTVFENNFVLPQPPVKLGTNDQPIGLFDSGSKWDAWPDFVALDFSRKRIQVVEVTKTLNLAEVKEKVEKYKDSRYDSWIRQVLPSSFSEFPIIRHFFLRQAVIDKIGSLEPETTPLERVFDAIRNKMP